MANEKHI